MRLKRNHYAALLFMLALFGSLAITGVYPQLVVLGFFFSLIVLVGGFLHESGKKVDEGNEPDEAYSPSEHPLHLDEESKFGFGGQ